MDILKLSPPPADVRLRYGSDAPQFGDLRLPKPGGRHPLVIVIHGGFWRAAYGLDHTGHLCAALTAAGLATWNLEYRRIGNNGGGWPGTFEDVLRGTEYVAAFAAKYSVDAKRTIAVGHSAGGHLALLLAARRRVRGVVSLAGVADLRRAWKLGLSNNVVASFLGGSPQEVSERYRQASPLELLPFGVPQRLVHGGKDDVVPFEISENYVKAANAAGDDARLVALPEAGHFELIDPRSPEWPHVQQTVLSLL